MKQKVDRQAGCADNHKRFHDGIEPVPAGECRTAQTDIIPFKNRDIGCTDSIGPIIFQPAVEEHLMGL
jgi:hypothetical protein